MPETRHISETETLVIKDDTISFMTRAQVSGVGTRSGVAWSRWRTTDQQIFSWKTGVLNRYRITRAKGRKFFINETANGYYGVTTHPFDIAVAERLGIPLSAITWRDNNFSRAIAIASYPLIVESENWSPNPGAARLLRAPDIGVGVERLFGKALRSDELIDAVVHAPLTRVLFVSAFRGTMSQGKLIDALVSGKFESESFPLLHQKLLRKLALDMNYATRSVLLMKPGRRMQGTLQDYDMLLQKKPDWYPRGRHQSWDSLRAEIKASLTGQEWQPPVTASEPMSNGGIVFVDEVNTFRNFAFESTAWPTASAHSRGAAVDISESMERLGVTSYASDFARTVNEFAITLTPPPADSIVREVNPF